MQRRVNMDPVRNDFVLAFDSLNNYIEEVAAAALRYRSSCI